MLPQYPLSPLLECIDSTSNPLCGQLWGFNLFTTQRTTWRRKNITRAKFRLEGSTRSGHLEELPCQDLFCLLHILEWAELEARWLVRVLLLCGKISELVDGENK